MENKGKGPEELLAEYDTIVNRIVSDTETGLAVFKADQHDWLRSSMADLLRWSAEQMPEKQRTQHGDDCSHWENKCDVVEGSITYNTAIDDCKATLLRLADEICPK